MDKPIEDVYLYLKSMINIISVTSEEVTRHLGSLYAQTENQNIALSQIARADSNIKKAVKDLRKALNNID